MELTPALTRSCLSDCCLQTTYPGVQVSNSTINMINAFLDWAQEQQDGMLSWILRLCDRCLTWLFSVDCFNGAAISLGSEPSSRLPVGFIRPPQVFNATGQPINL
jgi:hypothetical protein